MILTKIIIISISSFIVLSLSLVIIIIIWKNKFNSKVDKYQKKISDGLDNIDTKQIEGLLKRVEIIANSNHDYKNILFILEGIYDKITIKKNKIEKESEEFLSLLKFKKGSRNKRIESEYLNNFKEDLNIISDLISEFMLKSDGILKLGNFLSKEFNFYQERYKMIKQFYQQTLIKIDRISDPLVKLNNEIIVIKKKFDNLHITGKVKEASHTLAVYKNTVIRFAKILNEAPIIGDVIYNQIPSLINLLKNHYSKAEKELKSSLKYINFLNSLKRIRDNYLILKNKYMELDMKACKFYIVWIYKNIKSIETIINDEIRAQHDCVLYYSKFEDITKKSLEHYVIIKRQINGLIKRNIIDKKFKELYAHIISLVKEINNYAINFSDNYSNKNIPFVSKKFKMRQIFELNLTLLQTMNYMLIKIYDLNNALINYTNRLKYISSIITDLYAEINILGINITEKDKQELHLVDEDVFKLEKLIFGNNVDYQIINESFKNLESKIILIFDIIGSKKAAVYIVKNLLTHFASKRKLNSNFNYKMSVSEKQYLSGEYIKSLNTIITAIEDVK